jgi:hypothetical protein
LITELVNRIDEVAVRHPVRVGLDGPDCAELGLLAARMAQVLPSNGRPVALIAATSFYRDASVRLEYGKTDVESFYSGWLDQQALQREVLLPLSIEPFSYLPTLRDAVTNRSTRDSPVALSGRGVLIVTGELLLAAELSFDLTIHADVSRAARRRRTEAGRQWTLPAFDRYDIDVDPCAIADVVIRYDDPGRPALAV